MNSETLYIDNLSGEEFEQYLANLFQKLGYKVELTKTSGDYGADLIISNSYGKKVVQAKRYNGSVCVVTSLVISIVIPVKFGNFILAIILRQAG